MLSIATIPMALKSFTGCICAVLYNGQEYRLATYRGARVEQWSGTGAVIRQGTYRLSAELLEGHGCPLRAPVEGSMGRTIWYNKKRIKQFLGVISPPEYRRNPGLVA